MEKEIKDTIFNSLYFNCDFSREMTEEEFEEEISSPLTDEIIKIIKRFYK